MAIGGVDSTGGQLDNTRERKHTERVEQIKNDNIDRLAKEREDKTLNEVDETA